MGVPAAFCTKNILKLRPGRVWIAAADAIGEHLGIPKAGVHRIVSYLADAGLIKVVTLGPGVGITKAGIDAVEEALTEPDRRTEHFAPINVITISGTVHNSQIQVGGRDNRQTMSHGFDAEAVRALLPELRQLAGELREPRCELGPGRHRHR